jgi:hypothetical protein
MKLEDLQPNVAVRGIFPETEQPALFGGDE